MRSPLPAIAFRLEVLGAPAVGQARQAASAESGPDKRLKLGFQIASPILAKRAADHGVSGVVVDPGRFIVDKLGVPPT